MLNEQQKRMQKLAGIINESQYVNEGQGGLITFKQIKQACIENYEDSISGFEEYDPQELSELSELSEVNNISELVDALDGLGFNGTEAYDFIFDSILK